MVGHLWVQVEKVCSVCSAEKFDQGIKAISLIAWQELGLR